MKKVIMFTTPTCGYCGIARRFIEDRFPDLKLDYIDLTKENGDEMDSLISALRNEGVLKGVPATILIESQGDEKQIKGMVRGYNQQGLLSLIAELKREDSNQLELEFPKNEK